MPCLLRAKQKAIRASGTSTVRGNSLARPLSFSQHLLECEYIAENVCLWSGPQEASLHHHFLGFTVHCPPPHLSVLSSLLQAISEGWFWKKKKKRFILGHICFTPRVVDPWKEWRQAQSTDASSTDLWPHDHLVMRQSSPLSWVPMVRVHDA